MERDSLFQLTRSCRRRFPRAMNFTLRRGFVRIVSPVNPIFRRMPGLCRTENLPKPLSFSENRSVPRLLSSVASKLPMTTFTMCSASFLVESLNAC
jgi:hypothetical protein